MEAPAGAGEAAWTVAVPARIRRQREVLLAEARNLALVAMARGHGTR
jgi:hypothetical protein